MVLWSKNTLMVEKVIWSKVRFLEVRMLAEPLVGDFLQFGIPFGAEAARQRAFEETIGAHAILAAEYLGTLTDLPSVEIDSRESRILLQADRIERAGYGLEHPFVACAPELFEHTETESPFLVGREDAISSFDQRCHKISLLVDIRGSLLFDHLSRGRREMRKHVGHDLAQTAVLLFGQRCAGISGHTTFAQTRVEVTFKISLDKVERYQSVFYL